MLFSMSLFSLYMQDTFLYSPDGSVYLVAQGDGNLVLYRSYNGGVIFASGTYGASPQPFVLTMQTVRRPSVLCFQQIQKKSVVADSMHMHPLNALPVACFVQDCNLVLYSGSGAPIFYSSTYNNPTPCSMQVSSANGGFIQVGDGMPNLNPLKALNPDPMPTYAPH